MRSNGLAEDGGRVFSCSKLFGCVGILGAVVALGIKASVSFDRCQTILGRSYQSLPAEIRAYDDNPHDGYFSATELARYFKDHPLEVK
jgi:hypothetical protein